MAQYRNTGKGAYRSDQFGWHEIRPNTVEKSSCVVVIVRWVVSAIFWALMFLALAEVTARLTGRTIIGEIQMLLNLNNELTTLWGVAVVMTHNPRRARIGIRKGFTWNGPKPRFSIVKWAGGWVIYDQNLARPIMTPLGDANQSYPKILDYGIAMAQDKATTNYSDYAEYELDIQA